MKNVLNIILPFLLLTPLATKAQYTPHPSNIEARRQFEESRFGIFIHWGLYAMLGQGEWAMTTQGIDNKEYAKLANAFYPHDFNAQEWIEAIKNSGARYITFTSRHHDGFSMWNTKQSDYNIINTPYGKDIIKQLAQACHDNGIKLHLYYSHIDWTRDDYPAGRVGKNTGKDPAKANWPSYYQFMNNQLTELLTNYGPIGCIWFDGVWDHDQDTPAFNWQLEEQYRLIHKLQPACLIGNNHHETPYQGEDIQMFERDLPGENKAGLSGQAISHLPLETCETMNGMWGYRIYDKNYKSVSQLVQLLVRSAGKGANLLLNIGPQPDGKLPQASLDRLKGMGEWLAKNGETIYATQAGPYSNKNYVSTQRDNKIWLHILNDSINNLTLATSNKIKSICDYQTKQPIEFKKAKDSITIGNFTPGNKTDYIIEITVKK